MSALTAAALLILLLTLFLFPLQLGRAQAAAGGGATQLGREPGRFGAAVALAGELAVVGAPEADGGRGAAYVYRLVDGAWRLQQQLAAPSRAAGAFFGGAVAAHGERVAVGAWGAETVYLYVSTAAGWELEQELTTSVAGSGSRFGSELALAEHLLVVAAPNQGQEPLRQGAVHLFHAAADGWRRGTVLAPPELGPGARFGSSLALAGELLAIGAEADAPARSTPTPGAGASGAETAATAQLGAVYLYELGGEPRLLARLAPPPGTAAFGFGGSVALAPDLLAVGAPGADYGGAPAGPLFLFRRTGSSWKLAAQLGVAEGPAERLGAALALWDGAVVSSLITDNDRAEGSVRIVAFAPEGERWQTVPELLLALAAPGVRFVDLAASGGRLLAGVPEGAVTGTMGGAAAGSSEQPAAPPASSDQAVGAAFVLDGTRGSAP